MVSTNALYERCGGLEASAILVCSTETSLLPAQMADARLCVVIAGCCLYKSCSFELAMTFCSSNPLNRNVQIPSSAGTKYQVWKPTVMIWSWVCLPSVPSGILWLVKGSGPLWYTVWSHGKSPVHSIPASASDWAHLTSQSLTFL